MKEKYAIDWILDRNLGVRQYARKPEFYKFFKEDERPQEIKQKKRKTKTRKSLRLARATWERHFKIKIPVGYHIHHKDKDRNNVDPSNLLCLPAEEHIKLHELRGDKAAVTILSRTMGSKVVQRG